jgi:hypothetical protein
MLQKSTKGSHQRVGEAGFDDKRSRHRIPNSPYTMTLRIAETKLDKFETRVWCPYRRALLVQKHGVYVLTEYMDLEFEHNSPLALVGDLPSRKRPSRMARASTTVMVQLHTIEMRSVPYIVNQLCAALIAAGRVDKWVKQHVDFMPDKQNPQN